MKHDWTRTVARAMAPLAAMLALYLYVGSCGGGRGGFVLAMKAGRISLTAAWCSSANADP